METFSIDLVMEKRGYRGNEESNEERKATNWLERWEQGEKRRYLKGIVQYRDEACDWGGKVRRSGTIREGNFEIKGEQSQPRRQWEVLDGRGSGV